MQLGFDIGASPEFRSVLSAVIPITKMAGKLANLESWIYQAANSGQVQLILVHDIQDIETKIELDYILDKIKHTDTQLLEGHFGNPGAARNHGVLHCDGEWVTFWDSDDIPSWENILTAIFNANGAEALIGEFNLLNLDKSILHIKHREDIVDSIIEYPGIWRMVFHNSLLKRIKFPELLMGEDQVMLAGMNLLTLRVKIFDLEFYNYQVGNNYQLTENKRAIQDIKKAIESTWEISQRQANQNLILTQSLLYSQVITAFKKGTLPTKFSVLKLCLTNFFWSGQKTNLDNLLRFLHVVRIKNEKRLKCISL